MKFSNLIFPLSIIIFIVAVSTAQSATIRVPADQPTIRAGMNSASNGDTVLVSPGTYKGHIDFKGKAIVLRSEKGADSTVITKSGGTGATLVFFINGEDSNSVIEGFTLTGGGPVTRGGAINCILSSPIIANNIIEKSVAHVSGGGINCVSSSPIIFNNVIRGNSTSGSGGGIYCNNSSSPRIINNTISRNSAASGAGIICLNNSNPIIEGNVLSDNSARWGGAINCAFSVPILKNNTIVQNSARQGGGIFLRESSPTLDKCIIAFNSDTTGALFCEDSYPVLYCSDVFGNIGGDWVGCIASQANINGNFSLDPLFCDTANGDFHIANISSCTAANSSCGILIGALDVNCYVVCADANGDSLVNFNDVDFLIAYYFYSGTAPFHLPASDLNCDGSVNIADITYLAAYLNGTGAPPCCAE